jgi:hypothetical protein
MTRRKVKHNGAEFYKGSLTFVYNFDGEDEVEIVGILCGKVNVWDDLETACELGDGYFDEFLVKISDEILEDILDPAE